MVSSICASEVQLSLHLINLNGEVEGGALRVQELPLEAGNQGEMAIEEFGNASSLTRSETEMSCQQKGIAVKSRVNAKSLTRPAVVKRFCIFALACSGVFLSFVAHARVPAQKSSVARAFIRLCLERSAETRRLTLLSFCLFLLFASSPYAQQPQAGAVFFGAIFAEDLPSEGALCRARQTLGP